jgi:hypothetical protein
MFYCVDQLSVDQIVFSQMTWSLIFLSKAICLTYCWADTIVTRSTVDQLKNERPIKKMLTLGLAYLFVASCYIRKGWVKLPQLFWRKLTQF